jgi:pyruvate/2-oxoglutarate dehydrogenase complex dihydrolipoamide acyltransferase (E2) component
VLLEIETDKAQMDVEAQEDGILTKILVPNGTHNVSVGKMIAILAQEGDDISSLELPAESESSAPPPAPAKEELVRPEQPAAKQVSGSHKVSKHTGPYLPSVSRLLQEHGINNPESIPTSGPQGRLLKGDVLAFVGTIKSDVPNVLKGILAKKQVLDLSNIIVQKPQEPKAAPVPVAPPKAPELARLDTVVRITKLLQTQRQQSGLSYLRRHLIVETLAVDVQLDSLIEKASNRALADVPAFGLRKRPAADIIFSELIGEEPPTLRQKSFFMPKAADNKLEDTSVLPPLDGVYGSRMYFNLLLELTFAA